jgi:hypothetical protein
MQPTLLDLHVELVIRVHVLVVGYTVQRTRTYGSRYYPNPPSKISLLDSLALDIP